MNKYRMAYATRKTVTPLWTRARRFQPPAGAAATGSDGWGSTVPASPRRPLSPPRLTPHSGSTCVFEREKEGLGMASVRCPLSGDYMFFFLFYQVLTDCLLIQCHIIIINAIPHVCVISCLLIFNCHASN